MTKSHSSIMKIVFLTHDSTCSGGAQLCLVDLIKGIKMQNPEAQLYLLLAEHGDIIEACQQYLSGYKVIEMDGWWFYWKKLRKNPLTKRIKYNWNLRKARNLIANYLLEIKPQYAVTNSIVVPQLAVACKKIGVPHIWFLHEMPALTWDDYRFVYSDKTTFRKIDKLSTKILVTSDFAHQYYKEHIGKDNIHIVMQSVDIDTTVKQTSKGNRYTILMLGRIESTKGQLELLHAIKKLKERGVDALCHLVGRGETHYEVECQQYIAQNDLNDNVVFMPFTQDVTAIYGQADVLVNCSVMESFCRVAVEAQLCGLPVVLSDVGANLERVIDGVNGFIYQKGNADDLADKLEYLSKAEHRREFSDKIELLQLEKHSIAAFANSFLSIINSK